MSGTRLIVYDLYQRRRNDGNTKMNLSGTRSLTGRKTGSAGKYPALAAALRERIVAGAFLPGERLPRAHELQSEFDTTKVTALRAVAVLAGQGFLRTEERAGVFVARHPPHLSHFAMAFPWGARHMQSQFFGAIEREAARLQAPERRVTMFHDMAEHAEGTEAQRLCRLAEEHRLAGIVFAHNPYMLDHSPIVQESGIPRVAIAMADDQASMPTVYPDLDAFWRRALERLASHGRRRLAILMLPTRRPDQQFADIERKCARYGLTTQRTAGECET